MTLEEQAVRAYRDFMFCRYDDNATAYYFSCDDFAGLNRRDFSFISSRGDTLKGCLYHYGSGAAHRVIVFDHGIGGGHRSYMKEIEMLCSHGYKVFAYDHTGCMESGGEGMGGMAQTLCDLNDCIAFIKEHPLFSGADISVVGHSAGGFAALNITALQQVSHIVALCGFVSVEEYIRACYPEASQAALRAIMAIEEQANARYAHCNAAQALSRTEAKALLIFSDNDSLCPRTNYDLLHSALEGKENIRLLLVHGKGHNPNYTVRAVTLLGDYIGSLSEAKSRGELVTASQKAQFVSRFDWDAMTAQDTEVWDEIFACLDA